MRNFVWTVLIAVCLLALIGCDGGAANVTPATTTGTPPCAHEYEETVEREPGILTDGNKICLCSLCGDRYEEAIPATRSIKVLALGNSFSADAMEYLWQVCQSGGLEKIVLGNLYVSGCSLDKHWRLINDKVAEYTYYKNTSGVWNETTATLADTGVLDEDWDFIIVQQYSGTSGQASSHGNLDNILSYLRTHCTNPEVQILWHMTWAYPANSAHKKFPNYGNDQMTMYNAIVSTVQSTVLPKEGINGVIPCGTAIQNLRSSYVGDTVTRDNSHMSYSHGRYTTALTWYAALTGGSVEDVTWMPSAHSARLKPDIAVIHEAVRGAMETPFAITPSQHPTRTN